MPHRNSIGLADSAPTPVDLALVLAIDTSGSVTEARIALQIGGYANAFTTPALLHAVREGRWGRIAATFVQWSDAGRQMQAVDWTLISDQPSALGFSRALTEAARPTPGWTSISGAIDYAVRLFARSGVAAARRVIDISGDGVNNDGRPVAQARDDAVAAGITINGLPILEVDPRLDRYYRDNVIGGRDAFIVTVRDTNDFAAAVLRKLLVEVAGISAGSLPRG
jgi:hypothetical protein